MRRILSLGLVVLALQALPFAAPAQAGGTCASKLLVLSAFPAEIDNLLLAADLKDTVSAESRTFYVGTLRGNDVVLALTGIGLVNAKQTTELAFKQFRCGSESAIEGVVFSGVAGGRSYIGDVTVPSRWTGDDGKTWLRVNRSMFSTARRVAKSGDVKLERATPAGDPACVGAPADLLTTVGVDRQPAILVGGDGKSADPFGGRRFPCWPGGGDVFGCDPCSAPSPEGSEVEQFLTGMPAFLDPAFFTDFFANPPPAGTTYVAEDMETAAVAKVAAENGAPFIAFRAVSDGKGDPLMLPGFPFQFFYYRQLAADNAATMTLAFLKAWAR